MKKVTKKSLMLLLKSVFVIALFSVIVINMYSVKATEKNYKSFDFDKLEEKNKKNWMDYCESSFNDQGKKVKPTKDANVAYAEESSKYEGIIYTIYDRVYKIMKFKIEAASELLGSLKKVFNRRIQEVDMERFQANINRG